MESDELNADRYVVGFLRSRADMTQAELGKASGVNQSDVSKYELGKVDVPEDTLRRMAKVADLDWSLVVHLRRFLAALLSAAARGRAVRGAEPPALSVLEPALLAAAPYLLEDAAAEPEERRLEEARREADEAWTALERFSIPRRRRLLELSLRASRSCALAARVCEASVRVAAHDAHEALELAELALFIAGRVPEGLRSRAEAYCWAHVGNARRVANAFDGADEAFALARDLWRPGAGAEAELLPEWQLLDLEASLRREQHRFPEALKLLDRARAASGEDPIAVSRILLKKEQVFDVQGDTHAALAALAEAAPFVKASRDPRLLFALSFKTANNLCHLERHAEAEELLPDVRELAQEQGNKLDLIRVGWLESRVAAGQGRTDEAVGKLERVWQDFLDRDLPYDAALAALDLAVLWLETGRTAEVAELAVAMEAIFKANKIHREALMALRLFCDAAKQETATVELARRAGEVLGKARR